MKTSHETLCFDTVPSPIGTLCLVADDEGLHAILFEREQRPNEHDAWIRDAARLAPARKQLAEYFAGERHEFALPLHPLGTPFQLAVWEQLARIPFGAAISYTELAQRIGKPTAMRAVGAAIGRNPLPIVLPCHRVIGADGSLTGYSGGLRIKRHLLALEGRVVPDDLFAVP